MAMPEQRKCPRCDTLTHGHLCNACIADELDERERFEAGEDDDDPDFCGVADGKPPEATQAFLPSPESDGKPFCRTGGSL